MSAFPYRPTSVENQLFKYAKVRLVSSDIEMQNVILKVAMGEYPVGTPFAAAVISTAGAIILIEQNKEMHIFPLYVRVGEEVCPPAKKEIDPAIQLKQEQEIDALMNNLFPSKTNASHS